MLDPSLESPNSQLETIAPETEYTSTPILLREYQVRIKHIRTDAITFRGKPLSRDYSICISSLDEINMWALDKLAIVIFQSGASIDAERVE